MTAESARHVMVVALEVRDQEAYALYRAGIAPIMARHNASFGHDFEVSKVFKSDTAAGINRVFSLIFPDRDARERFFSAPDYLAVRSTYFEKAVVSTTILAAMDQPAK